MEQGSDGGVLPARWDQAVVMKVAYFPSLSLSLSIGDSERKLSLPISFLCDRHSINIPESQKGAITNCPLT